MTAATGLGAAKLKPSCPPWPRFSPSLNAANWCVWPRSRFLILERSRSLFGPATCRSIHEHLHLFENCALNVPEFNLMQIELFYSNNCLFRSSDVWIQLPQERVHSSV